MKSVFMSYIKTIFMATKKKIDHKINMRQMFLGLQKSMTEDLKTIRENVDHEPTKGDGSENTWITFFRDYLPKRYSVAKAKVVDFNGNTSDAIDVVIYDSQYTPFVFNKSNVIYIPAESVYAVFESKQEANKALLEYASKKIESVRVLVRTTAPVVDKGIVKPAPKLFRILGGFLALDNSWTESIDKNPAFEKAIRSVTENQLLDIGCILDDKSFTTEMDLTDQLNPAIKINYSTKEETLIYFFLKLVAELQKLGTVRPIDINKYIDQLNSQ
jgi:hypothetical protein